MAAAKVLAGLMVVAVVVGTVCAQEERPAVPPAVVDANNAFGLALYKELSALEGNLFLSPYSISSALAMTWVGARGATAEQMAEVLRFGVEPKQVHAGFQAMNRLLQAQKEKKGCELSVANALWGQEGFRFLPEFLDTAKTYYGGGLRQVDFVRATEAARLAINKWVEGQTRQKIKDLIPQGVLDPAVRLVLTNAIYFKGDWQSPFDKNATREEDFTLADGKKVRTAMMRQTRRFGFMEGPGLTILEMPYAGGELAMTVLLPSKHDELPAFEKSLDEEVLAHLLRQVRPREVQVTLPKFTMTREFGLAQTLAKMGMRDAFNPAAADFSGMTGTKDLFISAVIHKAFVDVNEEGTEAAAATGVVMSLTAAPMDPPAVFKADHPFVFLIRDRRTGSILFIGRVANPKG